MSREILDVDQAAELLSFSAYTIREKARDGELPGRKVGREWRFLRSELLAFIGGRANEEREMRKAVIDLLEELSTYYWETDDPELEIVNRLRRMVGMRDQLPKAEEVELQADEAEAL